jgi:hypothetical protein
MCTGVHFQGVKLPLHEVHHSPPPGTDVNNTWIYVSIPPHVFMPRCSVKHRDNFILSLPKYNINRTKSVATEFCAIGKETL